jgi:predicted AlkP superfamily pyrophosphatase or phosphodiesterase
MELPNYKDGCIVNLMSSISKALGAKPKYKELKILPAKELKSKNIVLIVIDGLGYNYLKAKGSGTVFMKHLKGKMTSVFPATTAAAITTFSTGMAAQEHGITGWFMFLKELGVIARILPFNPRYGSTPFWADGIDAKKIIDIEPLQNKLKPKSYYVGKKEFLQSGYNQVLSENTNYLQYDTIRQFFSQLKKAVKPTKRKKYVYAYWPGLDEILHEYGTKSIKAEKHLKMLDRMFSKFMDSINGTDTTIILTADHGFVNAKSIFMSNHPKLKECLVMPLCGEGRAAYCYVHPSKAKQFENYVKTRMKKYCWLYKSEDAVRKNLFGLHKPHPKLMDRIGDYILVMKKNYLLKDTILDKKPDSLIGHHAGVTEDEMIVPLIVVESNSSKQ